jgi:hypothetical protein
MKKLKRFQKGRMFGKDINIDLSKNLTDQPWFKSDLFCERHKELMKYIYEKTGGRDFEINEISRDEYEQ